MNRRTVVLAGVALATITSGILLSQGNARPAYQIPSELFWFNAMMRVPTADGPSVSDYVAWDSLGKGVLVGLQEKDPNTNQWVSAKYVYPTACNILGVAPRLGGQELYVSGIQLDQVGGYTDIIEKWMFPTPEGSYATAIAGGVTAIGKPRGSLAGSMSIVGGSYVTPGHRVSTPQPVPDQTYVYSKHMGGHFDCVAADPEGRFLLLHNYASGDLLTLDLMTADSTPKTLFTAAQIPALHATRSIDLDDVPGVGRICRLSPIDPGGAFFRLSTQVVVLVDRDNDGIFDSFTVHSAADVARGATPYGDSIDWHSVTNFGWDWRPEFGR
jgi:hypothetical protein